MDFHCPDMSADKDGNGFVSTEEGLPMYGDIFISLTTTGDTAKTSGLAVDRMPTADADGNVSYDRTIPAADLPEGTLEHLKDLHVVQHGIDANNNDKYDLEGLGESTLAKSAGLKGIPQEATDPATCGMISGAAAGSVPVGGVATGDGSTRDNSTPMYAFGGIALLGALGLVAARRRLHGQS
jgi:LPXTG-motif cell wall-anchored protein